MVTPVYHPAELHFELLGPLDVLRDGRSCAPTAFKQRALIALLLCRVNEVVPTAALVDGLWGESPPASALPALHGHVSAVRRRLTPGPGGADPRHHPMLRTQLPGYLLRVAPDRLDLTRFRAAVRTGRTLRELARCEQAGTVLTEALALWHGPALADLRSVAALDGHAARLEEEQLAATQELISIETCMGRSEHQVGLLEELCARYPLREPLHELLMVVLFRSGRRAEALAAYARARRVMIDEVGVEPGADLQRTHQAVLAGGQPRLPGHPGHPGRQPALAPRPAPRHHVRFSGGRISQSRRRW